MKFLFMAAMGAIIGYITNWLAIKMLFRPHSEKRLLGIKIPFTPGLIPNEKPRIAKSVGEAVGNHLLTKETIVESLCSNGMSSKLKKWVEAKVIEIEKSEISIGEQIRKIVGSQYEDFTKFIKERIANFTLASIKKERFKQAVVRIISESIKEELLKKPQTIMSSKFYAAVKTKLNAQAIDYKNSEEFRNKLYQTIENKIEEAKNKNEALDEIIPTSFISSLKVYTYNKNFEIAMGIKKLLNEESIRLKIKNAISDMLSENLNPMIAMFVNADTIFNKVLSAIEGNLDKEDTQREIVLMLNDIIDKVLKNRFSEVISGISDNNIKGNISTLSDVISKNIDNKIINDIFDTMENKITEYSSIDDMFRSYSINSEKIINEFVSNKINSFFENEEFGNKLKIFVINAVDNILKINLYKLSNGNEEKVSKIVSKTAENIFNRFVTNKAADFIEAFNISQIVEDRINSFDVAFAEEIILEIASKELRAITWLGALLGSIMGLLSAVVGTI